MYFNGFCLSMKFLKEFITVNRKFKPRFEFILNLHSCNHSAIEIIEAPALLWKRSKKHKPQSRKVTLLISFLGFVQLDILIPLAGWTGGREREGSCCHYGGITARQAWCDGWAHPHTPPFCFRLLFIALTFEIQPNIRS